MRAMRAWFLVLMAGWLLAACAPTPAPLPVATPPTIPPAPTPHTPTPALTSTPEPTATPTPSPASTTAPTETQTIEFPISGTPVTINGESRGFILVDPKPGEFLNNFGLNPNEVGWSQTSDGKWVIFDRATGIAIETMGKKELERLKLDCGLYIVEPVSTPGNTIPANLIGCGFFIGYEERDLPLNPNDLTQGTARFNIFRFFVPYENSNKCAIIEAPIFGDKESGEFLLTLEFREPSLGEKDAGVVYVYQALNKLAVGDTVKFYCPVLRDRIKRIKERGYQVDPKLKTFLENHVGIEDEALRRFNEGISGTILIGEIGKLRYFPYP